MHRLAILVVVVAVAWAATARATTVGVLRAGRPPAVTGEAMIRVLAELRSLGLEPRMLDAPEAVLTGRTSEPPWYLRAVATERGVDAVIALPGAAMPAAVEVWAADGKGRSVARRISLDPKLGQAPQTIAIRAIELLRSCLLEIDLLSGAPVATTNVASPPASLQVGERRAGATLPVRGRLGVAVGAVVVFTASGVGPAVLPSLRADWQLAPIWLVRAEAVGRGTRGLVDGKTGSALVGEDELLLGAGYWPFPERRLRPMFALSAGALRTAVEGRALVSYQGHDLARWSFLVDGAAGASFRLSARWELTAAAHLQAALPAPVVRFVGQDVATAAHPNILLGLTAEVWL